MPQFEVKLFQSHWQRSHTETFNIEATSEEDAKKQADKIAEDKDLKENFDFEITDLTPEEKTEPVEETEKETE